VNRASITGPTDIGRLRAGDRASLSERVDDRLVRETARLTGDDNPIHLDPTVAFQYGQSRPVAHGVILLGLVSRLIGTKMPGPGSVWFSSELEFLAPVFPGDDVTVEAEIAHVSIAARVVTLQVVGRKGGEVDVLRGRVRVRVPEPMRRESSVMTQENVVIITGASRGVGRAIAESLAPGGRLVLGYRENDAAARAAADTVQQAGGEAVAVAADVSAPDGAAALVDAAMRAYGRVDAIVHAATPPIVHRDCLDTRRTEMHAFFDTYVVGFHELVQLAAPGMKERRHGRIVGLLSSAIAEVPPKLSAYVAAKHALLGLCRALAVELGPFNIGVNTVSPSMVISEYADGLGAAAREAAARKSPMRRLASGDDVARCVKFLLSADAAFINGVNLPVTGGIFV
jgi:3-oxoacyl-[acyl-carrier protein] reductase